MALENFDYATDWGSGMDLEQDIKEAQFGNGYKQTVAAGLNPTREIWTFSIFGTLDYVGPALEFLRAHTGKPFLWTEAPLGPLQVKATDLRLVNHEANAYTLSAKFTQDFSPVPI